MASAPPIKNMVSEKIKYKLPMSLWLVVNNQRLKPVAG
jgi:hypothetical protein